jgi:hypothetical protein
MHRLHPPGDFCLKERINVNDSTDYFGAIGAGRVTHVAVQHRMGILSERRAGSRACDFADSGTGGASLVESTTGSLATHPGDFIAWDQLYGVRHYSWPQWSNCADDANPSPRSSRASISWWTRSANFSESVSVAAAAQSCRQSVRMLSAIPRSLILANIESNYHATTLSCSLQIAMAHAAVGKTCAVRKNKAL